MTRRALAVLLLTLPLIAAPAQAKPVRKVRIAVTIDNATGSAMRGWTVGIGLAKHTRLVKAKGFKTSGRTGAVVLTPRSGGDLADGGTRFLRVVLHGRKAPKRVSVAGQSCTRGKPKRTGRTLRVAVTCRLTGSSEPAADPTPEPSPAPGGEPSPSPSPAPGEPTPTPDPSPSPSPSPAPGATPFPVAPYVDMTLGAPSDAPDIAAARAGTGAPATTLGFITALGTACHGGWGSEDVTDTSTPYANALRSRLKAYTDAGGQLVLAFGGQSGFDIAQKCADVATTKAAYKQAIDAVGALAGVPITHIDLDVETNAGGFSADADAVKRQAGAVAQLQDELGLVVTYTLQTETLRKHPSSFGGGMLVFPDDGIDLPARLTDIRDAGVDIAAVNGMAMDYGSDWSDGTDMGADAISVAGTIRKTLGDLYPGLSEAQLYKKVGITLMIGQNDEAAEHTHVADVTTLNDWAKHRLAMVAMWSITRDHPCPNGTAHTVPRADCHGLAGGADWDFGKELAKFEP